ncbi:hypothetical protein E2C01_053135 [Portunus trituberculatus]|uniref:Uncharacterized protein n=1 Tax=Portunus trituberculatus TaxID=210409 RepID=A0A5B7GFM0_PORTR|nr:hypothetical protein [Portunus trituberculatus]
MTRVSTITIRVSTITIRVSTITIGVSTITIRVSTITVRVFTMTTRVSTITMRVFTITMRVPAITLGAWRQLLAIEGSASGRLLVKFEATKDKKLPVLCLGLQAGPDSHLLPLCGAQGRHGRKFSITF